MQNHQSQDVSKHQLRDRLQFSVLCDRQIAREALSFNPNAFFGACGEKGFLVFFIVMS